MHLCNVVAVVVLHDHDGDSDDDDDDSTLSFLNVVRETRPCSTPARVDSA
jgi:hypothetical protein